MDGFPERDPKNYVWKIFYFNKTDDRLFPPKPNPDMGWTINFAHPKARLYFALMLGFFAFVVAMIVIKNP